MKDSNSWESKFESCAYSDKLLNELAFLNMTLTNPVNIQEIKKAIFFAKEYHGNQKRLSGEPYYSHPLEVAYMLAEYAIDDKKKYFRTDLFVTAILHDTIEDTELTFAMIKNIFGEVIAGQVMDLTRIKEGGHKISSEEMVKSLWIQKKYDLLFIKQLDRLHNLQTIQAKSIDKIKKIVSETFNAFIVFAIEAQDKELEKSIYRLCCQTLSLEMIHYEFPQITQDDSYLIFAEGTDIHQSLSQVFQNAVTPIKNL